MSTRMSTTFRPQTMPARFTTLNNALEKGLDGVKPDAAVAQIEYWEGELKGVDVAGVKGLLHDLESLKKKLQADEVDGEAIKALVRKLGGETGRIAGRVDGAAGEKLKDVGAKLEAA